jgi:hypothetical protein
MISNVADWTHHLAMPAADLPLDTILSIWGLDAEPKVYQEEGDKIRTSSIALSEQEKA